MPVIFAETMFVVDMEPVPKGRPRVKRNGGVFTPTKTKEAESYVQEVALEHVHKAKATVSLRLEFLLPIPKRPVWRFKAAQRGLVHHDTRPDLDNLVKLVMDALNGVAWQDDKQVVSVQALKRYVRSGEEPEIRIKLAEWSPSPTSAQQAQEMAADSRHAPLHLTN